MTIAFQAPPRIPGHRPISAATRLVADGSVLPPRDLERLHAELARRGAAHRLGESPPPGGFRPLREIDRLAGRLRALLGVDA